MLTPREQEVVKNLSDGISNKVIAKRMGITERTVKAHLPAIFEKTGTVNRMEWKLSSNTSMVNYDQSYIRHNNTEYW